MTARDARSQRSPKVVPVEWLDDCEKSLYAAQAQRYELAKLLARAAFYLESSLAEPLNAGALLTDLRAALAKIESAS